MNIEVNLIDVMVEAASEACMTFTDKDAIEYAAKHPDVLEEMKQGALYAAYNHLTYGEVTPYDEGYNAQ